MKGSLGSDATKGDCGQVELVCWPRSIHLPYVFFMHIKRMSFFGTLRYTNFPINLSLSTVCLRQIFLAQSKCFNFFNFVRSSSSARKPLPGRRFEVRVRSILRTMILSNSPRGQLL